MINPSEYTDIDRYREDCMTFDGTDPVLTGKMPFKCYAMDNDSERKFFKALRPISDKLRNTYYRKPALYKNSLVKMHSSFIPHMEFWRDEEKAIEYTKPFNYETATIDRESLEIICYSMYMDKIPEEFPYKDLGNMFKPLSKEELLEWWNTHLDDLAFTVAEYLTGLTLNGHIFRNRIYAKSKEDIEKYDKFFERDQRMCSYSFFRTSKRVMYFVSENFSKRLDWKLIYDSDAYPFRTKEDVDLMDLLFNEGWHNESWGYKEDVPSALQEMPKFTYLLDFEEMLRCVKTFPIDILDRIALKHTDFHFE